VLGPSPFAVAGPSRF